MKKFLILLLISGTLAGCKKEEEPSFSFSSKQISEVIAEMTDVMVHDVTNPPLAARFYAYSCLAGYEVVRQNDTSFQSMHGLLKEYPKIEKPEKFSDVNYQLSALLSMIETAIKLQPSGTMMEEYKQQFLASCRTRGFSENEIKGALEYAHEVSNKILAYAKTDRYNQISNYPRYTPANEEGAWYPTPPGFFAPVEPYFNTIRSFTLQNAGQFKPAPPASFSKDEQSLFYSQLTEVYKRAGADLTKEQQEIAAFWDCNPFALQDNGHLMTGMKKISPGGHWLGITGIACQNAGLNFPQSMKINTLVSITLMDGFIACWDEKFRSNRIRPETAIRRLLDPQWKPLLQTPPFPEYLSGHSTVSSASAVVLTHFFGENFHYKDTVEERFGLPEREFSSFHEAAEEASISRLYGGIHFMDAIVNGQNQGFLVGKWVLSIVEGESKTTEALSKAK